MKFRRLLVYAICGSFSLISSCNSEEQRIEAILKNSTPITSNVIPHDFLLGNPNQITIVDTVLFISDNYDGKALITYDVRNKVFLGNQLSIGQGPNEILPPIQLGRAYEGDVLSVLQRPTGKYAAYASGDIIKGTVLPKDTITLHNTDRFAKTSSGFITTGAYQNGSLRLLDKSGSILNELDIFPDYIQDLKSPDARYIYGQGHIVFNKVSKVLAYASYFSGEVLFCKLDSDSITKFKSYDFSLSASFKNHIKNSASSAMIGDEFIEYFADIFSTDDSFYLLFSGVPMKDRRSSGKSYVFKFSSAGDFIESYKTDVKLQSLCVNSEESKIYAIGLSDDFEFELVEMDI